MYGVFGRKQEMIETININPIDLPIYAAKYEIKSVLEVSDKIWTTLINSHVKVDGPVTDMYIPSKKQAIVKSNVAIASAVTAYARIYMSQFKNKDDFESLYTDTDSIIIDRELPDTLIGNDLGLMKDELSGLNIKEAYFLGIKQYGYWYLDNSNNWIEKSVFAGIKRDSLTFEEIISLFKGETITKIAKERRFKSMKHFNIKSKNISTHIFYKPNKKLDNYYYLLIHINSNWIIKLIIDWFKKMKDS